jgi:uncharacterized protein
MPFDLTYVFVGLALLAAGFVKGTTGMGFPLIATPTVALLLDIRTAITILIIPNLVMDGAQVFRRGFPREVLQRFFWLILLTVVGVFLGTKTLVTLPFWILNLFLGVMIFIFVLSSWLRLEFALSPALEKVVSPPAGLMCGFLNGLTNAAGPALAIYLYSLKLQKQDFIRSIATVFIVTKITQLVAVSTWNLFNRSTLALSLAVTLFTLMGFYSGLKLQDRVDQKTFNRGLLFLLFVIGIILVFRALAQRA